MNEQSKKNQPQFSNFDISLYNSDLMKRDLDLAQKIMNEPPAMHIFTVSLDGYGDFTSIREAVDQVPSGSRIMVNPGIYIENLLIQKKVEIIGAGNRNEVVIKGATLTRIALKIDDETKHYIGIIVMNRGNLTLENCSINTGVAKDSESKLKLYMVGVKAIDHSKIRLTNCKIHNCHNGIVSRYDGDVRVKNCEIHNNQWNGLSLSNDSQAEIINCKIFENGSGISLKNKSQCKCENSSIHDNSRTGVSLKYNSMAEFNKCIINSNRLNGFEVIESSTLTLKDSQVHYNKRAGLRLVRESNAKVNNCDLTNNFDGAWDLTESCTKDAKDNIE